MDDSNPFSWEMVGNHHFHPFKNPSICSMYGILTYIYSQLKTIDLSHSCIGQYSLQAIRRHPGNGRLSKGCLGSFFRPTEVGSKVSAPSCWPGVWIVSWSKEPSLNACLPCSKAAEGVAELKRVMLALLWGLPLVGRFGKIQRSWEFWGWTLLEGDWFMFFLGGGSGNFKVDG